MKISLTWLNDYLDWDSLKGKSRPAAQELAEKLTQGGFEVESVQEQGQTLSAVLIGAVTKVDRHPNADKLSLCEVDLGPMGIKRIVCGAANVRAGLKVPVATEGVVLPNGMKIKHTKIRGEFSEGMICSESELGLVVESEGIMELPTNLKSGISLTEAMPHLRDTLFEVNITPNRPDCLGHIGLAREVAALYGLKMKLPASELSAKTLRTDLQVTIDDLEGCPAYLGRLLKGIKVQPSPDWVQERLKAIGLRPINQIVDATNYVLMEWGHPTHAFDARFLKKLQIRVRAAGKAQNFKTLDGKERALLAEDLLICDAEKPVALAGIMGGESSEIRDDTSDIVLECAYFQPQRIRVTARRLGMSTDSSYRFERGTDPQGLKRVMARLTELIVSWSSAGTQAAKIEISEVVEKKGDLSKPRQIRLDSDWLNGRLGLNGKEQTPIEASEIQKILQALDLKVTPQGKILNVEVPSFRVDLERPIDLVEDVARCFGFGRIPTTLPPLPLKPVREQLILTGKNRAHQVMARHGFDETIHYSFVPADELSKMGLPTSAQSRLLALKNPLAEDQAVLRLMLLPSLIRTATYNQNRGLEVIRLYELNKVFEKGENTEHAVQEHYHLAGVMAGHRTAEAWSQGKEAIDFFDLKGAVEDLLHDFFPKAEGAEFLSLQESPENALTKPEFLHPGKSAVLMWRTDPSKTAKSRPLGYLGEVHPEITRGFEFKGALWGFELDFDAILKLSGSQALPPFRQLPIFPAIRRDLALVVDENLSAQAVYRLISSMNKDIIENIHLFDVYKGNQIPEGKKSLAYAIYYLSRERTLTHEEIDRFHEKLLKRLNTELGAQIRS